MTTKNAELFDFSEEKNKIENGVLYLVATPIGNTADISERALKILSSVNKIAAEDTRNSGKLLSRYGIKQSYISYHEHNRAEAGERIVELLKSGESIALITDAGMPAISDPGEDLVKKCAENEIKVTCAPGASAMMTALVLSGLGTRRFAFEGFIGSRSKERLEALERVKDDDRTLIFYEAPHRLRDTLSDMLKVLGDRRIALCRELTKLNEEVVRTTLEKAAVIYADREPRGEYVLVVEGALSAKKAEWDGLSVEEHIEYYINSFGLSKMDAIKRVAKDRGVPKGDIYKLTIK